MAVFTFNTLENLGLQNTRPTVFNSDVSGQDPAAKKSYLNTPVYSNLEIPAGQYKTNDGQTIQFDGIRIDTVLFDVSIDKNIIRTAINGKNGTVKQFIAMGDYQINAQGLINGGSNNRGEVFSTDDVPEQEIRKLNAILNVPQEIEVISEFLDFFDVSTVVIQGGGVSQREGFRDSLYFSIGMLSDTPIELK